MRVLKQKYDNTKAVNHSHMSSWTTKLGLGKYDWGW